MSWISKNTIDDCYEILRSKTIDVDPNKWKRPAGSLESADMSSNQKENGNGYLLLNYNGRWPLFLVAPGIPDRRLFLLADADSTDIDMIGNWEKLSMEITTPENAR